MWPGGTDLTGRLQATRVSPLEARVEHRDELRGGAVDVAAATLGTGPFALHGDKKPRSPQQTVVKAGFGEKSNGGVKTDQYPRESRACHQPRRPQTAGSPLYQWGLMRQRSQPPHPTTGFERVRPGAGGRRFPAIQRDGGCGPHSSLLKPCQEFPAHTWPFRSSSTFSRTGLSMGPGRPGPVTAHDRWEVPMTPLPEGDTAALP